MSSQFSPNSGQPNHEKSHTWGWLSNMELSKFTPSHHASLICSTNKHGCAILHRLHFVQTTGLDYSSWNKLTPVENRTYKLSWQWPTPEYTTLNINDILAKEPKDRDPFERQALARHSMVNKPSLPSPNQI